MRHNAIFYMFPVLALFGCYSFTGSSLPSHIKTIMIPLCENQTLQPGISEALQQSLNNKMIKANLLRLVDKNGDSELNVKLIYYNNKPLSHDVNADVQEYIVEIVANVSFEDSRKSKVIYQDDIKGVGIYKFGTETIEMGQERALEDLSEAIINNTISGW